MGFYERYEMLCVKNGFDPCSQRMADLMKTTRSNISVWRTKGTTPKGDTFALMADALGTTADYLLGRTDDPTDYTKQQPAELTTTRENSPRVLDLYYKLDAVDRIRVEAYIDGMLTGEKYRLNQKDVVNA